MWTQRRGSASSRATTPCALSRAKLQHRFGDTVHLDRTNATRLLMVHLEIREATVLSMGKGRSVKLFKNQVHSLVR